MRMGSSRLLVALLGGMLLLCPAGARADTAVRAYRALGIEPAEVLTGTVLSARVVAGEAKQVVCMTTYFTGASDKAKALNVRLGVFVDRAGELVTLYSRDFGKENAGHVAAGDLQVVDLDMDGVSEIVASYESHEDPLIQQRLGEVILYDDGGFRTAWSGPLRYDATKAARDVPRERRDRFEREIDYGNTLRTRGVTLFMRKKVVAVAGEPLGQPKIVEETFPLRPRKEW
jgi:hypothetical protein